VGSVEVLRVGFKTKIVLRGRVILVVGMDQVVGREHQREQG
jgi:hypothetical protein